MKKLSTICLAFILFLIASATMAQMPNAFNYQALVRNVSGDPITNRVVAMRISILDVNDQPVYVEVHSQLTNSLGLVNLKIGRGTVDSGSFAHIDWAAGGLK